MKFLENPSCGSRVVPCGRTDRRTNMTKLIVAESRVFVGSMLCVTCKALMKGNEESVMYDLRMRS